MLSQTIASLFKLADNLGLEFMAMLALIWFGTLGYVITRKIVGLVSAPRRRKLSPTAA